MAGHEFSLHLSGRVEPNWSFRISEVQAELAEALAETHHLILVRWRIRWNPFPGGDERPCCLKSKCAWRAYAVLWLNQTAYGLQHLLLLCCRRCRCLVDMVPNVRPHACTETLWVGIVSDAPIRSKEGRLRSPAGAGKKLRLTDGVVNVNQDLAVFTNLRKIGRKPRSLFEKLRRLIRRDRLQRIVIISIIICFSFSIAIRNTLK